MFLAQGGARVRGELEWAPETPPDYSPAMPPDRAPLSAVIITLNAASELGACLASVSFADEILVVDSGSQDGTIELARAHGAQVIHQDWLGFGPQKQFAVERAKHDWVLCIDADERVSPRLRESIRSALADPQASAYSFARCNRFMGRYLRHGEGYPDWSLRLFDRRQARWSADAVHEKVTSALPPQRLAGDLLHESAESLDHYLAKQNRYTTLAAIAAYRAGGRAGVGRLLMSPVIRFIKFYLLRGGFLDGVPGLVHTLIGCQNSFAKYAKMQAFQRSEKIS